MERRAGDVVSRLEAVWAAAALVRDVLLIVVLAGVLWVGALVYGRLDGMADQLEQASVPGSSTVVDPCEVDPFGAGC
jgi:hypothetical protein